MGCFSPRTGIRFGTDGGERYALTRRTECRRRDRGAGRLRAVGPALRPFRRRLGIGCFESHPLRAHGYLTSPRALDRCLAASYIQASEPVDSPGVDMNPREARALLQI